MFCHFFSLTYIKGEGEHFDAVFHLEFLLEFLKPITSTSRDDDVVAVRCQNPCSCFSYTRRRAGDHRNGGHTGRTTVYAPSERVRCHFCRSLASTKCHLHTIFTFLSLFLCAHPPGSSLPLVPSLPVSSLVLPHSLSELVSVAQIALVMFRRAHTLMMRWVRWQISE